MRIKMAADEDRELTDVLKEFLTLKASNNCARKTIHNYEQSILKLQKDEAIEKISELTDETIIDWKKRMLDSSLSASSINHYLRDVRAFVNYCISKHYIPFFQFELIKQQEEGIKFLPNTDIEKLLEKPLKTETFPTWRSWMIVNWVYATGNRESTICEVRLSDVDFSGSRIYLRHTKSRKLQTIPLSRTLASYLKEYIRYFRKNCPPTAYLFPSIGDTKLTTDGLRRGYARYCKSRGVSNTSLHGIRHTFAQEWINNNGNLYQLQIMLGHSTPTMTQKYLRAVGTRFDSFEDFNPLDKARTASRTKEVVLSVRESIANDKNDNPQIVVIPPENGE